MDGYRKSKDVSVMQPLEVLEPSQSVSNAQVIDLQEDRNGQFHRSFTPRQVHIIALGSNIGSGVFIGTGKALASGGPGSMVIAYALVCSGVWAVLQTLSEMTIAFPTSGNYIDYAGRWVDPALAFGAGFAEWLGWVAIVGSEATFFTVLVDYWAEGSFPAAAGYTIFIVASLSVFLLPNKWFARYEYITSIVKIFTFLIIILVSLAIVCGAGPQGYVHRGVSWSELPAFKNGFGGFATCALLAMWAVGDQVFIGIIGGEAQSPRFSMAHATKLVPFRVNVVYMLSVIFVTLLVRSDDDHLLGGSGIAASPFIIAVRDVGIPGIGHVLNSGMIVGILAISAESIYLCSRVLRTMAHQKLIPEAWAKVDSAGRPRWALLISTIVGVALTYIQLSAGGLKVFSWLLSITSASFFMMWMIIAITNWRFRQALRAQDDKLFREVYAWSAWKWPLPPWYLLTISTLLLACCLATSIDPLGDTPFSAYAFFQNNLGVLLIVASTLGYKVIRRTRWVDPKEADLIQGRRTLSTEEIVQLDNYYRMSTWRRFCTYAQLW
ncbi:Amino-acid permease GAP1 [Exophiala dermatitidis]